MGSSIGDLSANELMNRLGVQARPLHPLFLARTCQQAVHSQAAP